MNGMTTSIDTCVQNGPNMGISNDQPPSLNEYTAGFQRLNALSWHSPFSPDILSTVWCFYSFSTGMAAVIFYSFFLIKAHVFRAYAVYPYAAQPFLVKSYSIYLYLVSHSSLSYFTLSYFTLSHSLSSHHSAGGGGPTPPPSHPTSTSTSSTTTSKSQTRSVCVACADRTLPPETEPTQGASLRLAVRGIDL
jgi:hypothetical protein